MWFEKYRRRGYLVDVLAKKYLQNLSSFGHIDKRQILNHEHLVVYSVEYSKTRATSEMNDIVSEKTAPSQMVVQER